METISPQTSPTGSVSPPVTPFSIALPHTYALPPIKTLPMWNRNKFRDDKLVRSVPKNKDFKVKLIGQIGQIENCTQTTPASSSSESLASAKSSSCRKSGSDINKLKKSFDKKIVFLETTHKEVLGNLHTELEKLKNQNRVLRFQLVMAGEDSSRCQVENEDTKTCNESSNKGSEEAKVLKDEITELKTLLSEADSKNIYLTKLISQLKQRSSASRHHSGHKSKTISANKSDHSLSQSNYAQRRDSLAKIYLKQIKSNVNIGENNSDIKKEKQSEISLVEEKLQKQNLECNVIFPKLEQNSRSHGITSSAITGIYKRTQEPLSLPLLQSLSGNRNLTLRQKRAQALHVRRQRSNKSVTLTATAAAVTNEE